MNSDQEVTDEEIEISDFEIRGEHGSEIIIVRGENGRLYWRSIHDQKSRWTLLPPLVITVPNHDD
jgi:hypothetical protein